MSLNWQQDGSHPVSCLINQEKKHSLCITHGSPLTPKNQSNTGFGYVVRTLDVAGKS
jgi:hypothetical protein